MTQRTVETQQNLKGALSALNRLTESIQSVAAVSEEQAASMEEIAAASQTLAQMAQDLQKGVGRFRV